MDDENLEEMCEPRIPELCAKIAQAAQIAVWKPEQNPLNGNPMVAAKIPFDTAGTFAGLSNEIMILCDDLAHEGNHRGSLAQALGVTGRELSATSTKTGVVLDGLTLRLPTALVAQKGWQIEGQPQLRVTEAHDNNVVALSAFARRQ